MSQLKFAVPRDTLRTENTSQSPTFDSKCFPGPRAFVRKFFSVLKQLCTKNLLTRGMHGGMVMVTTERDIRLQNRYRFLFNAYSDHLPRNTLEQLHMIIPSPWPFGCQFSLAIGEVDNTKFSLRISGNMPFLGAQPPGARQQISPITMKL